MTSPAKAHGAKATLGPTRPAHLVEEYVEVDPGGVVQVIYHVDRVHRLRLPLESCMAMNLAEGIFAT